MKPLAFFVLLGLNVGAIGAAVYAYDPATCPFVNIAAEDYRAIAEGNREVLKQIQGIMP